MEHSIEDFRLEPLKEGKYIQPFLARYRQDGIEKSWEMLRVGDGVAVLLWHRERERFVLVRQFRPVVYAHSGQGVTVELCAGLLDKEGASPEIVASEEVEEECGYHVTPEALEKITSYYNSVSVSGGQQILYYVELTEAMRVGSGGGVAAEGEKIEVFEITVDDAKRLLTDDSVPRNPQLLFALCWWFRRHPSLGHREIESEE